jgi:hypothetical protein
MFLNCKTNENVMPPEKIQISARISKELHDKCIQLYDNMTNAIVTGLELACNADENKCNTNENNCKSNENNCKTDENSNTELNALLQEKDERIRELQKDKEAIQNLYNNYMLQMQTLINQRAIEAPGAKKQWWRFW